MARKKGGGGKLNRSQVIQARFDPNLQMAAEIMARSDRRTLSSFIEKTIEQSAKNAMVKRNLKFLWWMENHAHYYANRKTFDVVTVEEAVQAISHKYESVRFVRFGTYFPDFLNSEEKVMYEAIIYTPYFWFHYPCRVEDEDGKLIRMDWVQVDALEGLDSENLLEYWDRLKSKQIEYKDICTLPIDKKLSKPMKEDVRALHKKIIKKSDGSEQFIFANQCEISEISPDESSWKKHVKNSTRQKIELKKSQDGAQVIATYYLEGESDIAWFESLMKNKEKQHDDQVHENNSR